MPTNPTTATSPKVQRLKTERLHPSPNATHVQPPSEEAQRIVGAMLAQALKSGVTPFRPAGSG